MQPVVFVMPGKTSPAGHEGVVAIADGVGGNIAEIGRRSRCRLLRHANRLVTPDKDQLRTIDVMGFEQHTIPGWRQRSCRQSCAGRIVDRRHAINNVAVALPEPCTILAMLGHHLKVDMLAEVELPKEAFAAEAFVSDTRTCDVARWTTAGQPGGRSFTNHGVTTDALHSSPSRIKRLAGGKESGIGVAVGELRCTVIGTQDCRGIPRAVVPRMPHDFNP